MSPSQTHRHLLVWSLPTAVVLLSYFWYKRKRNTVNADSGGIDPTTSTRISEPPSPEQEDIVTSSSPLKENEELLTPTKPITFSRSLSGVESSPIDIKTPRSAPIVISDTELDLEIEKIKSMKAGASVKKQSPNMAASPAKRRSPKKANRDPNSTIDTSVSNEESSNNVSTETADGNRACSVDRDSANHSPTDAMLPASPTLSSISDNQSDSDSGKGGSDVATPPPAQTQNQQSEASSLPDASASDIVESDIILYDFIIPQGLVGRLIGKHGSHVHTIKAKTNARIIIKRHSDLESKLKVCSVQGTQAEIDAALAMIREKFPIKRYPEITLEQVSFVPIVPECMNLRLIEGVNNDTIVSHINAPNHLFLQHPTHPTFPSLNVLSQYMMACYADSTCISQPPLLPLPILPGTICAAENEGGWFRSAILSTDEDSSTALIRFLDFGGFVNVPYSCLRQIRADFLLLPFQAAECMLANIEPLGGDDENEWCQEAYDTVHELTQGVVVFTQIIDYIEEDGVIQMPLVHIYCRSAAERGFVLLNRELVDRGYARWVEISR